MSSCLLNLFNSRDLLILPSASSVKNLFLEVMEIAYPEVGLETRLKWLSSFQDRSKTCNDYSHGTIIPKIMIEENLPTRVLLVKINKPIRYKSCLTTSCCDIKLLVMILSNPRDKGYICGHLKSLRELFNNKDIFNAIYQSISTQEMWGTISSLAWKNANSCSEENIIQN